MHKKKIASPNFLHKERSTYKTKQRIKKQYHFKTVTTALVITLIVVGFMDHVRVRAQEQVQQDATQQQDTQIAQNTDTTTQKIYIKEVNTSPHFLYDENSVTVEDNYLKCTKDDRVLQWQKGRNQWECKLPSKTVFGTVNKGGLKVSSSGRIQCENDNEMLYWNAKKDHWSCGNAGSTITMTDIDGVEISQNPTSGDIMYFDGTSWINKPIPDVVNGNFFAQNGNSFGQIAQLGTNDNYALLLKTNGVERVRITEDGNVGIGTSSPQASLHINPSDIKNGTGTITVDSAAKVTGIGTHFLSELTTKTTILKVVDDLGIEREYGIRKIVSDTELYINAATLNIFTDASFEYYNISLYAEDRIKSIGGFTHQSLDGKHSGFTGVSHSDTPWMGSYFGGQRYRGTSENPLAVHNGDVVTALDAMAFEGNSLNRLAQIRMRVDGSDFTNGIPGRIEFVTKGLDGIMKNSMVIKGNGNIGIGTDNNPHVSLENAGRYFHGDWDVSHELTFPTYGRSRPDIEVSKNAITAQDARIWTQTFGVNNFASTGVISDASRVSMLAHGSERARTRWGLPTLAGYSEIVNLGDEGSSNPGDTSPDGLIIGNYEADPLIFGTDNLERMRITPYGRVGIGTDNPLSTLHVKANADPPPGPYEPKSADIILESDGGGVWGFRALATDAIVPGQDAGRFSIINRSNGEESFVIEHSGHVGIGTDNPQYKLQVDGDIVPELNNTYNLGTSSLRWQDLYLGPSSLHIGAEHNEGIISYDTTDNYLGFDSDGDSQVEMIINDNGQMFVGSEPPLGFGLIPSASKLAVNDGNLSIHGGDLTVNSTALGYAGSAGTMIHANTISTYATTGPGTQHLRLAPGDAMSSVIIGNVNNPNKELHVAGQIKSESPDGVKDPSYHFENTFTAQQWRIHQDIDEGENLMFRDENLTRLMIENGTGNVGIGTITPNENLQVAGAINLGTTTNTNAGSIRWTGTDFEGHDGSSWVSFTSGGGASAISGLTDGITGTTSVFLGSGAGINDDLTTNSNTAVGINALNTNVSGHENVAFGHNALQSHTSSQSAGFGVNSLQSNTGWGSVGVGYNALQNNTGLYSTGAGYQALRNNTGGAASGFGASALYDNTGLYVSGFGANALSDNTADYVSGFGYNALQSNTGNYASGFGYNALYNNTSQAASGFGSFALMNNASDSASGFGYGALRNNTGNYSSGFGRSSLWYNTGEEVIGLGRGTLLYNQGDDNVAVGDGAFNNFNGTGTPKTFAPSSVNVTTNRITLAGHSFGNAGDYVNLRFTTGGTPPGGLSNNGIYQFKIIDTTTLELAEGNQIGNITSQGSVAHYLEDQNVYTNSTALGYNAEPTASNQMMLGNGSLYEVVPASDATQMLGSGSARWHTVFSANGVMTTSDTNFKKNITNLNYGLSELMQINPISYNWKDSEVGINKKIGFSAQQLQTVIPEVVRENNGVLGVFYSDIIPLTVSAIQEQNITITSNTLKTDANISTLTQLQDSIDTQLTTIAKIFGTQLAENGTMQDNVLQMQQDANNQSNLLDSIDSKVGLMQTQVDTIDELQTSLTDLLIALDEDNLLYTTDEGGLTLAGVLNATKIIADDIETDALTTGKFAVMEDEDSQHIGSVVIKEGTLEISIQTTDVRANSHVFVTVKDADRSIFAHVENIIDGESFVIGLNQESDEDVQVDWWIVDVIKEDKITSVK